jgi:hypothetical protein
MENIQNAQTSLQHTALLPWKSGLKEGLGPIKNWREYAPELSYRAEVTYRLPFVEGGQAKPELCPDFLKY